MTISLPRCRSSKPDPSWTQFRLTVGAPDAEAKFKKAIEEAGKADVNAMVYPVLYVRIDIKHDILDAYLIPYTGFPWISTQELAFGTIIIFFISYMTLHRNLSRSYDTGSGIGLSPTAELMVMVM
jgi:hypothetical protein